MEGGDKPACDDVRRWSYLRKSHGSHLQAPTALDLGLRPPARELRRELLRFRNGDVPYPATTPADLASTPEMGKIAAADRNLRRSRRFDPPARAGLPRSDGEPSSRCRSAHVVPSPHLPHYHCSQGEFKVKYDFSYFDGNLQIEDYLDWEQEVEDFFDYMGISPEKQVRLVVHKLKGRAAAWWNHLNRARRLEGRRDIKTWFKMRRWLRRQFLPIDYEQLSYRHYRGAISFGSGEKVLEVDASWSLGVPHDIREYMGSSSSVRYQIEHQYGFPSHLGYQRNAYEGNAVSENCHMVFKRGQTLMSNSCFRNGQHHLDRYYTCGECCHCREPYVLKQGMKLGQGVFIEEAQRHDNGRIIHPHHSNMRMDDRRDELPKPGRVGGHNVVDVNAIDSSYGHGNFDEGNERFQAEQTDRASPHVHIDGLEDNGVPYDNNPFDYGEEIFHRFQHNLPPLHLQGKVRVPLRSGTSYVSPGLVVPNGSMSLGSVHGYEDRSQKLSGFALDVKTNSPWTARKASSAHHSEHGLTENINAFPANVTSENASLANASPFMPNGNQLDPGYAQKDGADDNSRIPERKETWAELVEDNLETNNVRDTDAKVTVENGDIQVGSLEFLPELIATVKKAIVEGVEEVKAVADREAADVLTIEEVEEPPSNELEQGNVQAEGEIKSDGDDENKNF